MLLAARRAGSSHWPKIYINRHQLLRSPVTLTLNLNLLIGLKNYQNLVKEPMWMQLVLERVAACAPPPADVEMPIPF